MAAAFAAPALGELRSALGPGGLVVPGDASYPTVRLPWNRRYDPVRPLAIALPRSAKDVQTCVRWAVKRGIRIAVRSGGHSTAGQSSTTGLLVDLQRLAGVRAGGDRARVGPGARLASVYAALWSANGRTIPAGTAPTVGVSGLTLGGGHGFLSRSLGLACDSLVGAEIVTADGRIRRCSPSKEPDLYWALRGGGQGSFGVVTALEFETHRVDQVATCAMEWPWAEAAQLVAAWTSFVAGAPDELSCVLALRVPATPGGMPTIALNGLVVGTKGDAEAILEPLVVATGPTRVRTVQRDYDVAVRYFEGDQADIRRGIGVASGYARKPLSPAGREALVAAVEARHADPSLRRGGAVLFALGGAVNRVGPGGTAFVHRRALFSVELLALWDGKPGQARNLDWLAQARTAMRPHLSGEAAQNYADPALENARRAYYGANLPRLVALKRRVDPSNVFRHGQSIPTHL